MADQEKTHAKNVGLLAVLVWNTPDLFTENHPVDRNALLEDSNFASELGKQIKAGTASKKDMLEAARDIENSIIESKYYELLTTEDPKYRALIADVIDQTVEHRMAIVHRIQEPPAPPPKPAVKKKALVP